MEISFVLIVNDYYADTNITVLIKLRIIKYMRNTAKRKRKLMNTMGITHEIYNLNTIVEKKYKITYLKYDNLKCL